MSYQSHLNIAALWAVVLAHPSGVTAKQVAAELDKPASYVSTQLSRMAAYNMLRRVPNPTGNRREYRYQVMEGRRV